MVGGELGPAEIVSTLLMSAALRSGEERITSGGSSLFLSSIWVDVSRSM